MGESYVRTPYSANESSHQLSLPLLYTMIS